MQGTIGAVLCPSVSDTNHYHYAVRIKGLLDARHAAGLQSMTILHIGEETILEGPVADSRSLERLFLQLGRGGLSVIGAQRLSAMKEADMNRNALAESLLSVSR